MASPPAAPPCASCGARLEPEFRFCSACGTPVSSPPPLPPLGAAAARARLVLVRNDGAKGPELWIDGRGAVCGRTEGAIRLADDATVSPRHARFTVLGGVLRVEDLGSVNGSFLRLRAPCRISAGAELRVGRQLLRLEALPRPPPAGARGVRAWGSEDRGWRFRLAQLLDGGGLGDVFPLREGENVIGREAGEVTFPSDRYVSARHARLAVAGDEVTVADAGSSNGTFSRIAGAVELARGDELLVGAQLLRVV
jgi:pSer/pThr/pTyr-binding forkhead associated (FHA) protein